MITRTAPAHGRWPEPSVLLIVLGVILAHGLLLQSGPLWLSPSHDTRTPVVMQTRTLTPAPAAPSARPPAPARSDTPPSARPAHDPAPATAAVLAPADVEREAHAITVAPVALPASAAASLAQAARVDLPPFDRPEPAAPPVERLMALPESARLRYAAQGRAKQLDYWANAELRWQVLAGQRYEARLEVGAFLLGSRVQTSMGSLGPQGLVPQRFADRNRSELSVQFDAEQQRIRFSTQAPEVPLLPGAQDRLSLFVQLSALIGAEPTRYPVGTVLSFQVATQSEAQVWHFRIEPDEWLQLPIGALATVKLVREPLRLRDQKLEIWLARERQYLPARLRLTNANQDWVDLSLRDVEKPSP